MQNDYIVVPKKIKVIAIMALIILATLIISSFIFEYFTRKTSIVQIDHDGISSSLPEDEWVSISDSVYALLHDTLDVGDSEKIEAKVREYSYQELMSDDVLSIRFLLDVDLYKQTYDVSYSYSRKIELSDNILINCPVNEEMKYPNESCVGMYNTSNSIEMYLPHYGEISSGEMFIVRERYYSDNEPYLEIAINSCGDRIILEEALESTFSWLESINIDPNLFNFETPKHYCDGGAG